MIEELKNMLWQKSPYQNGEHLFIKSDYIGGGSKVKIIDIGFFERNELFPFEYLGEYEDGRTEWLKGHALEKIE